MAHNVDGLLGILFLALGALKSVWFVVLGGAIFCAYESYKHHKEGRNTSHLGWALASSMLSGVFLAAVLVGDVEL